MTIEASSKRAARPDPRRAESWCREGAAHQHDACGMLWDSSDPSDRERAVRYADDLGQRERSEIRVDSTEIRLIERDSGWVFGIKFPDGEITFLSSRTTAQDVADLIAAARARQIREERALTARPACVGDVLGVNDPIPINVLEVETTEDRWRRAFGDDRYPDDDLTGGKDESQEYDWITAGGGGWTIDDGLYDYAPIKVTKVEDA